MARIRQIVKYGGTYCIKLSPADLSDLFLKIGSSVDIEDIIIINANSQETKNGLKGGKKNGKTRISNIKENK